MAGASQLYWQVYLNLEREFLGLTDTVFVNDAQQEVFSMRIADLLIRTAIEIEAIAKDLYLENGGVVVPDEDMYFDTVCLAYLDKLWNLDKKTVLVVSPNVYFEKDENKILYPLHKAMKRGKSSVDWNRAYQAVKHNRVRELSKGSIKHLLHSLAALYVLNLYYRDEHIENLSEKEKVAVNPSFGSSLFAVRIHRVNSLLPDGAYPKSPTYDECIYIDDYESKSKAEAMAALAEMNEYTNQNLKAGLQKMLVDEIQRGSTPSKEWLEQKKIEVLKKVMASMSNHIKIRVNNALDGRRYNIVLNKQQY